ncbi:MAG: NAD(P)-dependent oxidoreductase [Elusimicrobiota bacterium]|nr:NAD(P)-dependent oxidoreductase [Elusimicrobiota bacterium]
MGNSKTAFSTLGASNHSARERAEQDLYTTDKNDVSRFLQALRRDDFIIPEPIYEPCAGLGDISKVLIDNNYEVFSADLIDRTNWDNYNKEIELHIGDFFEEKLTGFKTIFTNPPYVLAKQFVKRGLQISERYVIMLLRIQFLESQGRQELFKNKYLKYVYVASKRANCYRNGDTSIKAGAVCYAWFIFDCSYNGEPIIRWF